MGGRAGQACADPVARTPIGVSGIGVDIFNLKRAALYPGAVRWSGAA